MKWMVPETSLGLDQREVINNISKDWSNAWIQGHAGSGKSVLLVHLVRDYLAKNPKANVCVVVFTRSLIDMIQTGIAELELNQIYKTRIPVFTIYQFKKSTSQYDAVFCDEVQDLPQSFLEEMNEKANTVIVAGDPEQSIYDNVPQFNDPPASVDEIADALNATPYKLHYIYRMTQSVLNMLSNVFNSILKGKRNIEEDDVEVRLMEASSPVDEIKFVWDESTKINKQRNSEITAVLLPGRDLVLDFFNAVLELNNVEPWEYVENNYGKPDYGNLNRHLDRNDIPMMYEGNGYGSLQQADRQNNIIVMNYYSAKGLDFDHVFLPMLSSDVYLKPEKADTLLFVALSRSKYNLYITYTNEMYYPLRKFVANITPSILGANVLGLASII